MKLSVLLSVVAAATELGRAQGCCSSDQDCMEKLSPANVVSVLKGGDVGGGCNLALCPRGRKRQGSVEKGKVRPPYFKASSGIVLNTHPSSLLCRPSLPRSTNRIVCPMLFDLTPLGRPAFVAWGGSHAKSGFVPAMAAAHARVFGFGEGRRRPRLRSFNF